MIPGSDISVYDQHDRLVLAVEVKKKINASKEWAIGFRHNILAHELLPDTDFFLIVTPDRIFVWKADAAISAHSEPTLIVDAAPFFAPYFMMTNTTPEDIGGSSFELIVTSWLAKLMYAETSYEQMNGPIQWLTDLGLVEAIKGGHLGQEVLA